MYFISTVIQFGIIQWGSTSEECDIGWGERSQGLAFWWCQTCKSCATSLMIVFTWEQNCLIIYIIIYTCEKCIVFMYIYKYIYISENILSIEHPSLYCKHLFYLYQYSIRSNHRLRTVCLERSGNSWVWVGCMMCHLRSSRVGTTWTNSGGECCTLKKALFYAKERTFYGLYTGCFFNRMYIDLFVLSRILVFFSPVLISTPHEFPDHLYIYIDWIHRVDSSLYK